MREKALGRKHSLNTKKKLSKIQKGKPGVPHTEHSKEKIRQANIGKKKSITTKIKISKNRKGKLTGKDNPSFIGEYLTPWGIFNTVNDVISNSPFKISKPMVKNFCITKNLLPLSKTAVIQNPLLNVYAIGLTPKYLGFGFILR